MNTEKSFFAHKNIWQEFSDRHVEKVNPITDKEKSIDQCRAENPHINLSTVLKNRDKTWANNVDAAMKENFGKAQEKLSNLQGKAEPLKLLQAALAKLEAIDTGTPAFLEDERVYEVVDQIRKLSDSYKKMINKHQ